MRLLTYAVIHYRPFQAVVSSSSHNVRDSSNVKHLQMYAAAAYDLQIGQAKTVPFKAEPHLPLQDICRFIMAYC